MDSLITDVKFEIIQYFNYDMLKNVIPLVNRTFHNLTQISKYKILVDKALENAINDHLEYLKHGDLSFKEHQLFSSSFHSMYPFSFRSNETVTISHLNQKYDIIRLCKFGKSEFISLKELVLLLRRLVRLNVNLTYKI